MVRKWYPRSPLGLAMLSAGAAAQRRRTSSLRKKDSRRRQLDTIPEEVSEDYHVAPHSKGTEDEDKLAMMSESIPQGSSGDAQGRIESMQTDGANDATIDTLATSQQSLIPIPSAPNPNDVENQPENEKVASAATTTSPTSLMVRVIPAPPGRKRTRSPSRSPPLERKRPAQQPKRAGEEAQMGSPTDEQISPVVPAAPDTCTPSLSLVRQEFQTRPHTPTPKLPSLPNLQLSPSLKQSTSDEEQQAPLPPSLVDTLAAISRTNTLHPAPGESSTVDNLIGLTTAGTSAEDRNAARQPTLETTVSQVGEDRGGDEDQTSDAEDIVLVSRGSTPFGRSLTALGTAEMRLTTPGGGSPTTPVRMRSPTPAKRGCQTSDEGTSSDLGMPIQDKDKRKRRKRRKTGDRGDFQLSTVPLQPPPTKPLDAAQIPLPHSPKDEEEGTGGSYWQSGLRQQKRTLQKPVDGSSPPLRVYRPPFVEDEDDETPASTASTCSTLFTPPAIPQPHFPQGTIGPFQVDAFPVTISHYHNGGRSSRGVAIEDQEYEGEQEQVVYPEDPSVKARRILNESLGKNGGVNAVLPPGGGLTRQQPDYARHIEPNDADAFIEVVPRTNFPSAQRPPAEPSGSSTEDVSAPQTKSSSLAISPPPVVPLARSANLEPADTQHHSFPVTPRPGECRLREQSPLVSHDPAERLEQHSSAGVHTYSLSKGYCRDISSEINPDSIEAYSFARGTYGDVRRASLRDGRRVAIKRLRFYTSAQSTGRRKLEQETLKEIRVWSRLEHKNVLPLLGLCMVNDELGMVSEFMPNGNLQDYIRRNPAVDRYCLAIHVCEGLTYLHEHERRVVHGDLKAANVVVDANRIPKLMDFGLAQMVPADDSTRLSFSSSSGGGTVRWMARELIVPNTACCKPDSASDVHSLGMTIYEIFTGSFPYANRKFDAQVIAAIMRSELPERVPNVFTDGLWELLLRCWHLDPCKRPTARAVLATLQNLSRMRGDFIDSV